MIIFIAIIMLLAFQVQVPNWTDDSGSNPEQAYWDKIRFGSDN
jgi:hypothetical protein